MTMAKPPNPTELNDAIAFCLNHVGRSRESRSSLVLAGTGSTSAPREQLWAVLEDIERWPRWSPLHVSASWTGGASLAVGARFEQRLDLGFPLGRSTESVALAFAEHATRVGWVGHSGGVRSCHLWTLGPSDGGQTRVCNVEAFAGVPIALIKPLVASRWRRQFQIAVDGLIAEAQDTRPTDNQNGA
jgi:Polyketide cyclase / dehydrase and lipid transport